MKQTLGEIHEARDWPPQPASWPEIMTEIEVCQYLRLDLQHPNPANAKRSLRFIRRTQELPDLGRIGSKVLFRKTAVDAWLAARERMAMKDFESKLKAPTSQNAASVNNCAICARVVS